MANDQPFVDQPSPPISTTQSTVEKNIHGADIGFPEDEHARAITYAQHLTDMANGHKQIVEMLGGNRAAAESLHRKTIALTNAAPPYVDMP